MKLLKYILFMLLIGSILLSGCVVTKPKPNKTQPRTAAPTYTSQPTISGSGSKTPSPFNTKTPIPVDPTPADIGPDPQNIPNGFNPLTGIQVSDPNLLGLPAVLISITNFPPSARPQSGLSFASWVYEIYIAEGMTRFLAVYYGDYPKIGLPVTAPTPLTTTSTNDPTQKKPVVKTPTPTLTISTDSGTVLPQPKAQVGPIRSGRLQYVYIRDSFHSSCLVYAGATIEIRDRLRGCAMVYGSDETDINSAMLDVTKLQLLATSNLRPSDKFNYTGNLFSSNVPSNGVPSSRMDIYYSLLNQGQWIFDKNSGKYLKNEDLADGSGTFRPMTDRLNDQQLAYSNVIVLYTEHTVINPYIIDIKMGSGEKGKAVIFRDGQKFYATWTTMNGAYEKESGLRRPIRFIDEAGNPFPLKPGNSWVHIFTPYSYIKDQSDGNWLFRFVAPAGTK